MKIKNFLKFVTPFFFISCFVNYSHAQQQSAEAIAKKLANPVSSLISVPFQNNIVYGIGDNYGSQNILNIQPVIPVSLSKKINLIFRYIQPIVTQYNVTGPNTNQSALGDAVASIFVSPSQSKIVWAIGPVFGVPTATNKLTGTGKFSMGPTGIFLVQSSGWTYGFLAYQYWSVAGEGSRGNVTQGYLQPFLNYNWKSGAGIAVNAELTQNWKVKRTLTFINPVITGVTKLGSQTISLGVGPRIPISAPDGLKGKFGFRAAITLVFPK
ncbi:MAG: hypothetical protein M3R36_14620 [Bacteroidota bacterium]|nr:hypothetical protein [Bacteroidota bacterium]